MWMPTTRQQHSRPVTQYQTDLTDPRRVHQETGPDGHPRWSDIVRIAGSANTSLCGDQPTHCI
jgi:hypothetical protein